MKPKKEIMKARRDELKRAGLIKLEVWIAPEDKDKVKAFDMREKVRK